MYVVLTSKKDMDKKDLLTEVAHFQQEKITERMYE